MHRVVGSNLIVAVQLLFLDAQQSSAKSLCLKNGDDRIPTNQLIIEGEETLASRSRANRGRACVMGYCAGVEEQGTVDGPR